MTPLLELKEINFRYSNQRLQLIQDLNLELYQGEIIALTGHSGCGKSTLCHIACGVIPKLIHKPFDGHVYLMGVEMEKLTLAEISKRMGVVFQNPDYQIFSSTVEDELAFGMENHCISREEMRDKIKEISDLIGLADLLKDNPNQLSGGQKQLVVLGSILCMDPDILILDEAFSQLSLGIKKQMLTVLIELKKRGKGILMIDHQLEDLHIGDRLLRMQEGRLIV
ncbi:energy-coupling factor ABC transporter ATP-binding protein [Vallitalea okinawensis]|uniref:energy-coupling factor ABC transporter ATP-binding protein n=1 Tax=Vallitalea okinawensis TaxID=2078660 RepID=UPI001300641E|nr:ABC transporter ATP-binding protein [Vallitalea okinawensis]